MGYKIIENKRIHSNCPRKFSKRSISHRTISFVTNVPVNTVKAIRNGSRNKDTDTGQRIMLAEMLIEEGENKLLQQVKRIVSL